jgi:actin-related protein 3
MDYYIGDEALTKG